MKKQITIQAKEYFLSSIGKFPDIYNLKSHISVLEKWVKKMKERYPSLDEEIILLAVYLHDVRHYPVNPSEDHAIISEKIAKEFLKKEKYNSEKTIAVLHCVRSHRCKDVLPETPEAKAFAFIDSAGHMTDRLYLDMVKEGKSQKALDKLERDFRDLAIFPEIKKEIEPIYSAWKVLIKKLMEFEE